MPGVLKLARLKTLPVDKGDTILEFTESSRGKHFGDRRFDLYLYWISHGLLLLRSGSSNAHQTRIDLLFRDVAWMSIPAWMNGIDIEECTFDAAAVALPTGIYTESKLRSTFRIRTEGCVFYVVCAEIHIAEDHGDYFGPSVLLPDLVISEPAAGSREPQLGRGRPTPH